MNPADIPAPPAWVRDTVWYQIFPDRFCRSKGSANQTPWREGPVTNRERFGGDLPGICEKLDYLPPWASAVCISIPSLRRTRYTGTTPGMIPGWTPTLAPTPI